MVAVQYGGNERCHVAVTNHYVADYLTRGMKSDKFVIQNSSRALYVVSSTQLNLDYIS